MNQDKKNYPKVTPVDTGKIKIGIYYQPKPEPEMFHDMEYLQQSLLPRPLGVLHAIEVPSVRQIVRWVWKS